MESSAARWSRPGRSINFNGGAVKPSHRKFEAFQYKILKDTFTNLQEFVSFQAAASHGLKVNQINVVY